MRVPILACVIAGLLAAPASAQSAYQTSTAAFIEPPPPTIVSPPLAPATAMEAFRAATGAIVTMGYEYLGDIRGVFVDVREMRDSQGHRVRGLVVQLARQNATEVAFVDADEIAGAIKGIDALLTVAANPTEFRSFDMRFATKGDLVVTASSGIRGNIVYGVEVGRITKARTTMGSGDIQQLRNFFDAGAQKLASLRDQR